MKRKILSAFLQTLVFLGLGLFAFWFFVVSQF